MNLLEGIDLSKLCDYSFVEESAQWGNIFSSFMKPKDISLSNSEFIDKLNYIKKERSYMTLFVDNIRLYDRDLSRLKPDDKKIFTDLMKKGTLLELCSKIPQMKFIIFTNLEDTPLDENVFKLIPNNVLAISAVNAIAFGGKVIPAPYGLQRRMHPGDNRKTIIENFLKCKDVPPKNLLYINHSTYTNPKERKGINEIFEGKCWATVDKERISYDEFLNKIRSHKFMICPVGNAIDCHRNWEVLYLRRVPVMKKHPYLEKLYEKFPVLFVDNYEDVSEELLIKNNHLYELVKNFDFMELSLPYFYDNIVKKYSTTNEFIR